MAKSAMPKSKATTAYELLDEIAVLITEEPRRYDQTDWLRINASEDVLAPSCGTVGCVAGWVCALKSSNPADEAQWAFASDVLGLSYDQKETLFHGGAAGNRSTTTDEYGEDNGKVTDASIRAHAERGAGHIRSFMDEHEAQLKAKRV